MDLNVVYQEDCVGPKGMCQLPDNSVDMILCDLPYGTTALKWDIILPLEEVWRQYERLIKVNGAIVLTASQPFTSILVMSNFKLFKYELIWSKSRASDFLNANYRPMKKHENILVFSQGNASPGCYNKMLYNPQGIVYKEQVKNRKGSLGIARDRVSQQGAYVSKGTNYPTSILQFPNESHTFHSTQKPVALFEYLIKTYTNEGAVVLDNCIGSGTTAIACLNTNRYYVGYENDPEMYIKMNDRIEEHKQLLSGDKNG